jgi:hypothetical protein
MAPPLACLDIMNKNMYAFFVYTVKKVKLSLYLAVEAHRDVRHRGFHIF